MCDHGDTVDLLVTIPADLSHTGMTRQTVKPIDRCIAPAVQLLNENGFQTRASCCGHGKGHPEIILESVPPTEGPKGGR